MYQGQPQEMVGTTQAQDLEGRQDPSQFYKYGQPQGSYGGTMHQDTLVKPPFFNWRRRRLNLVAIFVCLFVPWLLFCFIFWMTSFKVFYKHPAVVGLIAFFALVFVGILGMKALEAVKKSRREDGSVYEPTWYIFLFLTSFIAWFLGMYMGYHNFYYRMESFYGIQNLGSYKGVDPAKMHGQQLMDAGRVDFMPGTHLDLSRSMSFRNNELYCIAPIVGPNYTLSGAPQSYDFWAVGVDCCCGDTVRAASFQCGEYKNAGAASGLRLMRDEQRPFFRLAVQQAVGAYGLRANHPLFFHWVQDPVTAAEAYRWEGHRQFLIGVYLHFAFQLLLVCLMTCIFARIGDDK